MRDHWMAGLANVLAVLSIAALAGCVQPSGSPYASGGIEYLVSLPEVDLAPNEYIQSFEIDIRGGRLSAIKRFVDDWSYRVEWDYPGHVLVQGQAGHFPAGLPTTEELSGTFVVRAADAADRLRVSATLVTDSARPPGVSEPPPRTLSISAAEVILSPTTKPGSQGRK